MIIRATAERLYGKGKPILRKWKICFHGYLLLKLFTH